MTETKPQSATTEQQYSQQYMPALTGVRAIAAFMVCFFHFNPFAGYAGETGVKRLMYGVFNEMNIGVSIFFVLSGFLICYRYYGTAVHITQKWYGRYMMNRVARIYPMYLLGTVLTFVLIELNPTRYELVPFYSGLPASERVSVVLLNLTMLRGFFNEYKFTGIAQGWSLTVEECFYLCAPFCMVLIRRSRWALLTIPICFFVLMIGLLNTFGRLHFHGLFENIEFMLNYSFFGRCIEFFVGIGLAVYVLHRSQLNPGAPARRSCWLTLLGSCLLLAALPFMATIATINGVAMSKECFTGIMFNNIILPIIIALFFYGLIKEQNWLRSILSSKLFDTLGKSSYIFYLIHTGVINILLRTYLVHSSVLQFLLLNIISVLLYKFVESPLHRFLKPR